jgi:hypothetical protein
MLFTPFRVTHLPVSALLVPVAAAAAVAVAVADLVGLHFRDPMACFLDLAGAPGAALVFVGTSCHKPDHAHDIAVVAVVGDVFELEVVAVAAHIRSRHRIRRTAVPVPICPAGHNNHRSTGRSCPGHGRSRNIAGRIGCRTPHAVGIAAVVPVAIVLGGSVAVVAAGGSCRIAVAGMPCRRYRMCRPKTRCPRRGLREKWWIACDKRCTMNIQRAQPHVEDCTLRMCGPAPLVQIAAATDEAVPECWSCGRITCSRYLAGVIQIKER